MKECIFRDRSFCRASFRCRNFHRRSFRRAKILPRDLFPSFRCRNFHRRAEILPWALFLLAELSLQGLFAANDIMKDFLQECNLPSKR